MIASVDSAVLLYLIDPDLPAPKDAEGEKIERCQDRLNYFIDSLGKSGGRLIVPTPVLAELLAKSGRAGGDWLNILTGKKAIRIAPFDVRAAVECAALHADRATRHHSGTKAKLKFDEQIIAISKIEQAEAILSDDSDIRKLAPDGVRVIGIGDLDLPPSAAQADMFEDDRRE